MTEKTNDWFSCTSSEPYDRHDYKIVSKTGDSSVVDNWESVRLIWFHSGGLLSHIEVLDKKAKGFG